MERKQLRLFFPSPFFPSCDLNPAGEGENSHVRHVGGAQLCKLHALKVFGMDLLAGFVFHGQTQREATFSTLTAATCCSVLLQRNPEPGESHCALALDLQGSSIYQGCAFVHRVFLLLEALAGHDAGGFGSPSGEELLGATRELLWCRSLGGIFKLSLICLP